MPACAGIFTYLALKYPDFGFKERPVKINDLIRVFEDQSVVIKWIDREDLEKNINADQTENFISYLCYGEQSIHVTSPFLFIDSSRSESVKWFALAHEMGHFFMHPFLRDTLFTTEYLNSDTNVTMGKLELEADYFANMILVPDCILDVKYKSTIANLLINSEEFDNKSLPNLIQEMTRYCLAFSSNELNLPVDKFPPRAILNLKLRTSRYVNNLRESLLISAHEIEAPFELSLRGAAIEKMQDPFDRFFQIRTYK